MDAIFGYGSLIWKPPPHAIERIPGYIKGFSRRFAQSSHDHRGTDEFPGRVVTLVSADEWHKLPHADNISDGDTVWGVVYRIDPQFAEAVKQYLDYREKDGYTCQEVDVYDHKDGSERLLKQNVKVYVGRFDNPSFTGPEQLDDLVGVIHRSVGPSGKNSEYLYNLVDAVSKLCPDSQDAYLEELNRRVRALDVLQGKKS